MPDDRRQKAKMPPRWVVRLARSAHRGLYGATAGRVGLGRPKDARYAKVRLTTIGHRGGRERSVILGYFEDGPNLVTMAMNGWADVEPAWWLNLQAHPEASVDLADGQRTVKGRAATGDERARLRDRWRGIGADLHAYAALRSGETAVVVLEPLPEH